MKFFSYGKSREEKTRLRYWFMKLDPAIKRMIIMRINLIAFLVSITVMNVCASASAQSISINVQQAPLKEVLNQIKKQSGYQFLYDKAQIESSKSVTINVKGADLKQVLDLCFEQQPLTYEIVNKTIVIKVKPRSLGDRITSFLKSLKVTGTITNEAGQPMAGVTVKIKSTSTSVITNAGGSFSLDITGEKAVLQFTYVGYQSQEITVNETSNLSIVLKEATSQLDEMTIVSTGYQTIPLERATGSFALVNKAQLEARVSTNLIDKLNGIANGLAFNKDPDGKQQLRIRGQSTLFSNAEPLIVLDGFPYDGSISNINPNDIESVNLLKDAAAASIWGVRAGNGVVVITTKRGKKNQPLQINFNSNITLSGKDDLYANPKFMSSADFIEVEKSLFSQGFYTEIGDARKSPLSPVVELLTQQKAGTISANDANAQIEALKGYDVRKDMQQYLYRSASAQQYALNLSGGTDKMNYFVSSGYDKQIQSRINTDNDRFTINSNTEFRPIKNLKLTAGLVYTKSGNTVDNITEQIATGGLNGKGIYPYARFIDNNGDPASIVKDYRSGFVSSAQSLGFLDWSFVPINDIGLYTNKTTANDIRLTGGVNYTFLKGLSADVSYVYENASALSQRLGDVNSYYTRDMINKYSTVSGAGAVTKRNIPLGSILESGNGSLKSQSVRGQLNFDRTWQKHQVVAIAGVEIRQVTNDNYNNILYGYDTNTATPQPVDYTTSFPLNPTGVGTTRIPLSTGPSVTSLLDRFRSYYSNASYTYDRRYTVSASGRIDQSNFFGVNANQRSVPLWSVGAKWDVSNEAFFTNRILERLALRATYGFNGNLDRNITAYTTAAYGSSGALYSKLPYASIRNAPNSDLRWEKTAMLNLGIDFGIRNGIVSGSIEYFRKKGTDLSGDAIFPPSSGVTSLRGNFADMKSSGTDIQLNVKILDRAFKWDTGFQFSYASEEVTQYNFQNNAANYIQYGSGRSGFVFPVLGRPVYGVYSYKWAGLDATGQPQGYLNGELSKNYATLISPKSLDDVVYNGPGRPQINGAVSNTLSWNNFSLFFNISYKYNYYFRRTSIGYSGLFTNWAMHKDFSSRWQQPGDELITNVPAMPTLAGSVDGRESFYAFSSALIERGDHIRLQDISLSYDLNQNVVKTLPFKSLKLYVYGNNVGILWRANKQGLDPDYVDLIPPNRSISFGIKAAL